MGRRIAVPLLPSRGTADDNQLQPLSTFIMGGLDRRPASKSMDDVCAPHNLGVAPAACRDQEKTLPARRSFGTRRLLDKPMSSPGALTVTHDHLPAPTLLTF